MFWSLPDGAPLDIDERCRLCVDPCNLDLDGLEGSGTFASIPFSMVDGNSAISNPKDFREISDKFMRLLSSRAAASLPETVEAISKLSQSL